MSIKLKIVATLTICITAAGVHAQVIESFDPVRAKALAERGKATFYAPDKFSVAALPHYKPEQQVSGTLRIWGSNYIRDGQTTDFWEKGFTKYHPNIKFEYHLPDSLTALGGIYSGAGDIGVGPKITWNDFSAFIHTFGYDPTEIMVATGSYNVLGWNPAYGVYVNASNPITQISMKQLDGIFGGARQGGWVNFDWHPEFARGPEGNLRTWGQLGLTGEWKERPIDPSWLNLRYHMSETISNRVLKGSDRWNENTKMYANTKDAEGRTITASTRIMEDVAKDPGGITISSAAIKVPGVKALAVSEKDDGPFVPFTMENVQNRTYPLADELYMYVNTDQKKGLDPKVKEFLRYLVSREGQEDIIRDGKYLPLTPSVSRAQLEKLK